MEIQTPWLGARRGHLSDWVTQRWVQLTGRTVRLADHGWLRGPIGATEGIGADYFAALAAEQGLATAANTEAAGLLRSFDSLAGPELDPLRTRPEIRDFYEHTAAYRMDLWSEWCGAFRPFGGLVAALFSRRLRQLNIPLSALEASRGIGSRVVRVTERAGGEPVYTGWVRTSLATGHVLYVGSYSTARLPGFAGPCVKVVFPLPNGSASVFLRPSAGPGGSLVLTSGGSGFGDPGFYFVVRRDAETVHARYLKTFKESIRVYVDAEGVLRTDHDFRLWGLPALSLHYRMSR